MHKVEFSIDEKGRGFVKLDGNEIQASAMTISVDSKAFRPTRIHLDFFGSIEGNIETEDGKVVRYTFDANAESKGEYND